MSMHIEAWQRPLASLLSPLLRRDGRDGRRRTSFKFRPESVDPFEDRVMLDAGPAGVSTTCVPGAFNFTGRSYDKGDITVVGVKYNEATRTATATFTYTGTDKKGVDVSIVEYAVVAGKPETGQTFVQADTAHLTPEHRTATVTIHFDKDDWGKRQIDLITGDVIKDPSSYCSTNGYGIYDRRRFDFPVTVDVPCVIDGGDKVKGNNGFGQEKRGLSDGPPPGFVQSGQLQQDTPAGAHDPGYTGHG